MVDAVVDDDILAVLGGFADAKLLNRVDPLLVVVDDAGTPLDAASKDEGCLFFAPSFSFSHLSLYLFIRASCFLFCDLSTLFASSNSRMRFIISAVLVPTCRTFLEGADPVVMADRVIMADSCVCSTRNACLCTSFLN